MKAKRFVSIICVVILLLGCCSLLMSCSQQTLSNRMERRIKEEYLSILMFDNEERISNDIPLPTMKEISLRYLGKHDGFIFVELSSLFMGRASSLQIFQHTEDKQVETSLDYLQRNQKLSIFRLVRIQNSGMEYRIYGYKDGVFYGVDNLYLYGYINQKQYLEIKNNQTHISEHSRKASIRFTDDLERTICTAYDNKYEYYRGKEGYLKTEIDTMHISRLIAIIDDIVVFELLHDGNSMQPKQIQIDGYTFKSECYIQAYRDGTLLDLDKAYEQNWFTENELCDLYQVNWSDLSHIFG